MASERLSRALMSMGEGFGQMAEVAITRERDEADRIHRESLARLSEQMANDRQAKEFKYRKSENEAERAFTAGENEAARKSRAAEVDADRKLTISENEKDRTLTSQRLTSQDRQAIESEAQGLLADVDSRAIELRDQLREGMLDPEAEASVQAEMSDLDNARRRIRYRMIEQLSGMGDPRYKGRSIEENMAEAGYNAEQIKAVMLDAKMSGLAPIVADGTRRSNPDAVSTADIDRTRPKNNGKRGRRVGPAAVYGAVGDVVASGGRRLMDLLSQSTRAGGIVSSQESGNPTVAPTVAGPFGTSPFEGAGSFVPFDEDERNGRSKGSP